MKPSKTLIAKWYKKLAASGFKDIEDTSNSREYLKVWDSHAFAAQHTPESFAERETYYQLCRDMLHVYPFASKLERTIWEMHSEGHSTRAIGKVVRKRHDVVADVIRKLRVNVSSRLK